MEFIKEYKGNILVNGEFRNEDLQKRSMLLKVLKWKIASKSKKEKSNYRLKIIESDFLNSDKDMMVWLGHASFYIQINGVRILTDPLFYNLPFIERLAILPCKIKEFKNIDYILLSHAHRDHLDIKSIKKLIKLNPNIQFLTPLGMSKVLKKYTKNIEEAGWFQKYTSKVEITFLPSYHWSRRSLNDFNKVLWGSFLIKTPKGSIYFGGDSAYGEHFKEIAEICNVDIAILSIGAYKPEFIMKHSHLSPTEAIKASNDLKAKTFIPMHYGTYILSDEPLHEPIELVYKNKSKLEANLKELNVGEIYLI